ncbi:hypothetical protein HDU98_006923 [Podochytrium sp. JEL0797]|nr:hypothetical protein HDU98_006923 [Podochytrium sp. JEL0797]
MPAITLAPIAPAHANNIATLKMNMHIRDQATVDTCAAQVKAEMESMVCDVCTHCSVPHMKHPEAGSGVGPPNHAAQRGSVPMAPLSTFSGRLGIVPWQTLTPPPSSASAPPLLSIAAQTLVPDAIVVSIPAHVERSNRTVPATDYDANTMGITNCRRHT